MNNRRTNVNNMQRRNNRRSTFNARIRGVQNSIKGVAYQPAEDPGKYVRFPWNSWTYQATGDIESKNEGAGVEVTPSAVTLGDITSQITGAYNTAVAPEIRILRGAAWITASQTNGLTVPKLTTAFYELASNASTDKSKRDTISDQGTLNKPACAGYVYPTVDNQEILNPTASASKLIMATTSDAEPLSVAGGSIKVTHRVHVLWRAKTKQFEAVDNPVGLENQ